MRLGWVVLAHDRPRQLGRLIDRLRADGDRIFVHVDAASPISPFLSAIHGIDDDVVLLPRIGIRWGRFEVAQATMTGIRTALAHDVDYVNVISGQDYPIKPLPALRQHLVQASGAAFMLYFALPNPDWNVPEGGLWRLNRRHYKLRRFEFRLPNRWTPFIPKRQMPRGHAPYAGSNWFSLPRACAQYLVGFADANPDYLRFYKRALAPAESMFHTILLNSPLRDHVVFNDLRYIVWSGGAHPKTLDVSDLTGMAASPAFLARKFDAERDPRLLDLIDEQLLDLTPQARSGRGD